MSWFRKPPAEPDSQTLDMFLAVISSDPFAFGAERAIALCKDTQFEDAAMKIVINDPVRTAVSSQSLVKMVKGLPLPAAGELAKLGLKAVAFAKPKIGDAFIGKTGAITNDISVDLTFFAGYRVIVDKA